MNNLLRTINKVKLNIPLFNAGNNINLSQCNTINMQNLSNNFNSNNNTIEFVSKSKKRYVAKKKRLRRKNGSIISIRNN